MPHSCSKCEREPIIVCDQNDEAGENKTAQMIAHQVLQSLIASQERELSNIARELHDDICQRLAMLSLKIEKTAKAWATGQKQVGEQLEEIWRQCSVLTGDVQALSHELHPSILDNLGLVTAVKSLCHEIFEQCGAVVDFRNKNVPDSLPREVSLSLFRLIQEALHNSLKHSGDNRVQVKLQGDPSGIEVEVCDHGVGFDAASVENRYGLGLVSMRERIELLNGTIHIDSKPNAGTRIYVWVPLTSDMNVSFMVAN
jgi:signal transduction histidine kinase